VETLADFVARHAVPILCAAVIVLLIATAVFWKLVTTYAATCWRLAVKATQAISGSRFAARTLNLPILGRSASSTMTAARFLGVFAILAFIFAAFALALFFEVVDEIGADESLGRFDVELGAALREHLSYGTLSFFSVITRLGDPEFLIVVSTVVAVGLLALRRRTLAGAWIVATVSGAFLNRLLKTVFERARPLHDHGLVTETSWSFPSGHASGSMLVYGLLGYLIVRHTPRGWHVPVALTSVAMIVFVGSSRVLLQVHYLSDVLAGYASGAAWVALCIAGLEMVRHRETRGQPTEPQ
jgi:membrane-associated phospholipid phosphatase